MYVIKYCKAEHNPIIGRKRLLLNSLNYFRELDHQFLGDANEGRLQSTLQLGEGESLSPEMAGALFSHSGVHVSGIGQGFTITGGEGGGLLSQTKRFPNCLLFCCRLEAEIPTSGSISFISSTYDSWYRITDPEKFRRCLVQSMARDASHSVLRALIGSGITIHSAYGSVSYSDSNEFVVTSQEPSDITALDAEFLNAIFVKESRYSEQREFRFVFFGFLDGQLVSLPVERLLVDLQDVISDAVSA